MLILIIKVKGIACSGGEFNLAVKINLESRSYHFIMKHMVFIEGLVVLDF